jgi:T5SS/PEP-CTERM-associated repeat protein
MRSIVISSLYATKEVTVNQFLRSFYAGAVSEPNRCCGSFFSSAVLSLELSISEKILALVLVTCSLVSHDVKADVIHWSNSAGGSFDTDANWLGGEKPAPADEVFFSLDADYEVTFNSNETSQLATVDAGSVLWSLNGHEYNLSSTSPVTDFHSLSVGQREGVLAELTILDGIVNANFAFVAGGRQTNGPGQGILRIGAGAKLTTAGGDVSPAGFKVGADEVGKLYISDGGVVESFNADIGAQDTSFETGTGFVEVSGEGSTWIVQHIVWIGRGDAQGTLTVLDGADVTFGSLRVAFSPSTVGSVTVSGSGSALTILENFEIGERGSGSVNVLNGASLVSDSTLMGAWGGASGSAVIAGANSQWINTGNIQVARQGSASIDMSEGGQLQTSTITVGAQFSGQFNLSGSHTKAEVLQSMTIGGGNATRIGKVKVLDGGTLNVGSSLSVLTSSSLEVSNAVVNIGTPTGDELFNGVHVGAMGTFSGNGTVVADVESKGFITPGSSTAAGRLIVDGNFTQLVSGNLGIQISRVSRFDILQIEGQATLHGRLSVNYVVESIMYQPAVGDVFQILIASGGVFGTFDQLSLPTLPGTQRWNVQYSPNDVSLLVLAVPEPSAAATIFVGAVVVIIFHSRRRKSA